MNTIQLNVLETSLGNPGEVGGSAPKAVIRITGLPAMPVDPTFRIEPIDDALIEDGSVDWPSGPRRPAAIITGDNQFDLVLGPDVLDSRLLVAGTPVSVSVCGTPAHCELVWPEMQVHAARPKRPVILTEQLRAAEREAVEARRREAAIETARAEAAAAAAKEAERLMAEAAARRAAERRASLTAQSSQSPKAAQSTHAPQAAFPASQPEALPEIDHQKEASAFVETLLGSSETSIPTDLYSQALPPPPASAEADVSADRFEPIVTNPTQQLSQLKRYQPDAPAASSPMQLPTLGKLQAVMSTITTSGEPNDNRRRQMGAFAAGLLAAMVLTFGLVQAKILPFGAGRGVQTPDVALASARANGTLRSVLATGGVSPRGRQTTGIDAATALALADKHLHGTDLPRDQGEASFWLRHALSQALEPEMMRWALTQLGTIHAAPEGFEPDYAKARMLWEVSSALGDPVAMCFNGSLYEYGLGIAKHKDLAHALYERARNAGGCPGVEQAIARTR